DLQDEKSLQHLLTQELKVAVKHAHQMNLDFQHQQQTQLNNRQKQNDLEFECINSSEKLSLLALEISEKEQALLANTSNLPRLQQAKIEAELAKKTAEFALNQAREQLHSMEKMHQELNFNMRLVSNEIIELENKINVIFAENAGIKSAQDSTLSSLGDMAIDTFKVSLQEAINNKQRQEQTLIDARNSMSSSEAALQQQERERMQNEQSLHPVRDKLEGSRLSEQEARLNFERCQVELNSCGMPEQQLSAHMEATLDSKKVIKVAELEKSCLQTRLAIDDLGAVNLAAIQELEAEQARRQYLASQSDDLKEAIDTLEDAIRKIDKDTGSRLQDTFALANRHFNDLFVTLFGGGQAGLALLGDEILDTGLQVFAQPPGKKNSTIHSLSGGEKALTALALVFALFRLNPAPFCLMDEVDAPLDDSNTERFCEMVKKMSEKTQFLYVSHNKITMEMAQQLIGVTMQESGVSRIVEVDMDAAVQMMHAAEFA
nr:AAA family ATPase [Methylotenera sp.]